MTCEFLDFDSLPKYHPNGFFISITPADPSKPLTPGDKLHNVLSVGTFDPVFLESSEHCFRWVGSLPYIFTGEHIFRFEPSKTTPGGTTFSQEESFTGALGFLMGDNFIGRAVGISEKSRAGWKKYNQDLKAWCEGSTA
jgi:hypothetical protein